MSDGLDWPVVAARFALVTLGVGLFGQACFPLYAPWTRSFAAPRLVRAAAPLAAAASGLAWIAALAREATGAPALPAPADILALAAHTGFGRALAAAVVLSLALAAAALSPRRLPAQVAAILAGGLLASLAFVGHAAGLPGAAGVVRVGVMAAHLLFAGVWLGGLLPLAQALRQPGAEVERLLRAFGRTALGSVAALATTGMIAAALILALLGRPPGGAYIAAFGLKLALVAALLAVAAVNRWSLTPLAARNPSAAVLAVAASLLVEQLLALALLATVARLAQLDPGM